MTARLPRLGQEQLPPFTRQPLRRSQQSNVDHAPGRFRPEENIMNRTSRSPLGINALVVCLLGMTLLFVSAQGQTSVHVTNQFSNTVSKIDSTTNTIVATIPVGNFPYGVAVSPNGDSVYVANLLDNTISVIDVATN